jgi:hypothetical protein
VDKNGEDTSSTFFSRNTEVEKFCEGTCGRVKCRSRELSSDRLQYQIYRDRIHTNPKKKVN